MIPLYSPSSFRGAGFSPRARNLYSQVVAMDSGLDASRRPGMTVARVARGPTSCGGGKIAGRDQVGGLLAWPEGVCYCLPARRGKIVARPHRNMEKRSLDETVPVPRL